MTSLAPLLQKLGTTWQKRLKGVGLRGLGFRGLEGFRIQGGV